MIFEITDSHKSVIRTIDGTKQQAEEIAYFEASRIGEETRIYRHGSEVSRFTVIHRFDQDLLSDVKEVHQAQVPASSPYFSNFWNQKHVR